MHTVRDPLMRAELIARDGTAVVCGATTLTYRDLADRVRRLANGLAGLGLASGDRVAIIADNCHRYVEAYLAVPGAGFVLVPLNTRSSPAEISFALEDAGVRILLTDRDPAAYDHSVERVVRMPDDYEDLLERTPPGPLPNAPTENDVAGLFYTGGTTGRSKGVMLTHRNLIANAVTALEWTRMRADDRWLVMAPMFHAAGTCCVLTCCWVGASQAMLPSFDAASALDLIEQTRATGTLAVPTMLNAMNDLQATEPRDVSSLRLLSHGASPAPLEILKRAHVLFPQAELLHLYGTTETAPIATTFAHEELHLDDRLAGSAGQPAFGVTVVALDPDGRPVPPGEIGEIAVRGNNVMAGYWQLPDQSAEALRGGWYHTGDLGFLTDDGYLFLVDRLKDMVVTGGENVYTVEVEDALYRHPAVAEAAVFGIPDERWGEAVYAVVVPRSPVTEDELRSYLRTLIASYKVPKRIQFQSDPLPKSGAGKILKRTLREPFWAGRSTRIGS
ncbi:AMP-dependent synthetase and ligase [Acidimicrobium ferrooxidans DSM 10331]|uniref:AMP-dependent synthetase and ligase n=1 Tax=Acidimicrobium ferrooxidans (strain DSM 10331 / JCM 15462 / NBRC 103882 / ICP) TaxID=525909 RepID=C7LZY5_ACIFD|nr:long-chain-fatty-acid--CoA ligase [Acidimicrobium ferrooxidans]ACU54293.1 AMP-dependent synthetase and ligase [Acidimicrobium ferrooxidans DSM 10331]